MTRSRGFNQDLRVSVIAAVLLAVVTTGAYFLQFKDDLPRLVRNFFSVVGLASFGGLIPGAVLAGFLEGRPFHGPSTAAPWLVCSVLINSLLDTVVLMGILKLCRSALAGLRELRSRMNRS